MKRALIAGVTILSVTVFGLPGVSESGANPAHLSVVGSAVMLRHAGQSSWDSTTKDVVLSPGDTIRTGSGSAILNFDDSTAVRAGENSELRLVSSARGQARVALAKGRLLTSSGLNTAVCVETPTGGADGTDATFSVSVGESDNVRVKVLKGSAQVRGKNLQAPNVPGAPTQILTAGPTIEVLDQKTPVNPSDSPKLLEKPKSGGLNKAPATKPVEVALTGSDVRRRNRTAPDEFTRHRQKPVAPTPQPTPPPTSELPPPPELPPPTTYTVAQDDAATFETAGGDALPYVLGGLGLAGLIALLSGGGSSTPNPGGGIPVSP